jgi:cell division protein FtsZ
MIGSAKGRSRSEKVLVVGIGSGTKRLLKLVHETSGSTIDTLFITTDEEDIRQTMADTKFLIGRRLCGGKGAMGLTELGERAAEDARRDLEPFMEGYNLILQVGTLGKGTASGAAHVIATIGESFGSTVINFLLLPSATLESMPRTIANHAKNNMIKRGFKVVSIDQDRFQEINGQQPFSRTLAALDALMSWIIVSMADTIYGNSRRSLTISDLRSVFKEGNEGSLFVGGSFMGDPRSAAEEFMSCGLLKRDPTTGRGFILNLVKPLGLQENETKPFIDEVLDLAHAKDKTVFIGALEDPRRKDIVDMIGIITGMDDGSVKIPNGVPGHMPSPAKHIPHQTSIDRWDIPMIR